MPRYARQRSSTGIYHIILRGINKGLIFRDTEDKEYFKEKLKQYKKKHKFKIYAYCLMDNHIHMIIAEEKETIGTIVKRISSSYVYYYNKKYERCGHLFQERYKSEPIEDDIYLNIAIRYIHQNPLKAGMVTCIDKYTWSSYNDYINETGVTDISYYLKILDNNHIRAVEKYKKIMNETNKNKCLEYEPSKLLTDTDAIKKIKECVRITDIKQLGKISKEKQKEILKEIKKIEGIGIRQIVRVTGIPYGIVRK